MKAAIFDLDNCISNDAWRIDHIEWNALDLDRRYATYHALCPFDEMEHREVLRDAIGRGFAIVVLTARPLTQRAVTLEWLRRRGVSPHSLLMRNLRDFRGSAVIKHEQMLCLPEYGIDLSDIVAAFDDREDVVDMYRRAGIEGARILRIHDVDAYVQRAKVIA